jgi:hypothetical protein
MRPLDAMLDTLILGVEETSLMDDVDRMLSDQIYRGQRPEAGQWGLAGLVKT